MRWAIGSLTAVSGDPTGPRERGVGSVKHAARQVEGGVVASVLVTGPLPEEALGVLCDAGHEIVPLGGSSGAATHEALVAAAGSVDGIVCVMPARIDREVLEAGAAGRLRVVANVGVGYDNIDVEAAAEVGVTVTNTPGVLDETTADLAFALILAASRLLSVAEADLRAGRWGGFELGSHLGQDVFGATLGIVGWGRIGRAVARRAVGFSMEVLHWSRRLRGEPGEVATLDELVSRVDVLSLHVPLTPETTHLIDDRRLRLMRPTAVLVNTARGPVVDEEALARALHEGRLFAAGLDVFEHEPTVHPALLDAPRTVLVPHIGSATKATRLAMAKLATTTLVEVLAGQRPPNVVTP